MTGLTIGAAALDGSDEGDDVIINPYRFAAAGGSFDKSSLWVCDQTAKSLLRLSSSDPTSTLETVDVSAIVGTGYPADLDFDSNGDIWMRVNGTLAVYKVNRSGTQLATFNAQNQGQGIAVNPSTGNVWVDNGSSVIYEHSTTGSLLDTQSVSSMSTSGPMSFLDENELWISANNTLNSYALWNVTSESSVRTFTSSSGIRGVGVDGAGDLWGSLQATTSVRNYGATPSGANPSFTTEYNLGYSSPNVRGMAWGPA